MKRTVTTIEIAERVVVSTPSIEIPRLPCPVCAGPTMVTPEEAVVLARVTMKRIYAGLEAEGVHFLQTPDGLLLLCANSLSQSERFGELKQLVCATHPDAETPTEKE
jgi:hypothetical protein